MEKLIFAILIVAIVDLLGLMFIVGYEIWTLIKADMVEKV